MSEKTPYQQFAENMMHPDSKYIPEILKSIINDEQALLLVTLPGTVEEMAAKLDLPDKDISSDLNDMFRKGLVFKRTKDDITKWRAANSIVQFHDASLTWPEAHEKFLNLWKSYMDEEWPAIAPAFSKLLPRPFTRVIPIDTSVDDTRSKILAPENIREILNDASRIAVTQCSCRTAIRQCDAPNEVCFQINRGADYVIERGSGREITKEEAFKIVDQARQAGLIHVAMNKTGVGHFICNCCGCCCQAFTLLILKGVELCDPSRYLPDIDKDKCTECGQCIERCCFNALSFEDSIISINKEKCMGCGQCAIICPEEIITLKEIREPDFIPQ